MFATAVLLADAFVLTVLAALALQALANRFAVPSLSRAAGPAATPRVAVLVPARNEAVRIGTCVRGWLAQDYPHYEVVVFDDDSTDMTVAVALGAGRASPRVSVVHGDGLPPGWRGKTHACHRLRALTRAELLVFADADIEAAPDTLRRAVGAVESLDADLLSALPSHRSPSLAVRAVVSLQNWAPLVFVPAWWRRVARSPRLAAANGQFLVIRASAYDAAGGFAAVRGALGEDVALARRIAALGGSVRLVSGERLLTCRPYRTLAELWAANVRNLYPALFASRGVLALAVPALVALYLVPPLLLGAGLLGAGDRVAFLWLPLAGVGLALASRALSDRRAGYAPWLAALHPLAVAALVAMIVQSAVRFRPGGTVEWRGRRYDITDDAA